MKIRKSHKIVKSILTKSFLIKEYKQNKKSISQIGIDVDIAKRTVLDYMIKLNIKRRPIGQRKGHVRSLKSRKKHSETLNKFGHHVNILHGSGILNNNYKTGIYCDDNYCLACGKEITKGPYDVCNSCAMKNRFKDPRNHPRWNNGSSFEPYPIAWTRKLKKQIRERDNYLCQNQECNKTQEENARALDVHHLNYDKDNLNKYNLISLCRSCHAITNSNRDYWYAYFTYIMENL